MQHHVAASIAVSKQARRRDKIVKRKQMTHRGHLLGDVSPGWRSLHESFVFAMVGPNVFNATVQGHKEFEELREDTADHGHRMVV